MLRGREGSPAAAAAALWGRGCWSTADLTCRPGPTRPRHRRQLPPPLPPVCTGPATRCPLATALALPLAAAPCRSRPCPRADWPEGELRVGARSSRTAEAPLAGGGAAGRDTAVLLAWAPLSQAEGGDWRGGRGGAAGASGEPRLPPPWQCGASTGRRAAAGGARVKHQPRPWPLPAAGASTPAAGGRLPGERLQLRCTFTPQWCGAWSWGPKTPLVWQRPLIFHLSEPRCWVPVVWWHVAVKNYLGIPNGGGACSVLVLFSVGPRATSMWQTWHWGASWDHLGPCLQGRRGLLPLALRGTRVPAWFPPTKWDVWQGQQNLPGGRRSLTHLEGTGGKQITQMPAIQCL